jgi:hypothetical protein
VWHGRPDGPTNSSAMQHQDETQAGRRYRSALGWIHRY